MSLRQSSQTNGGEEVDGEAGVSGVVPREEAFKERLQGPKKTTTHQTSIKESGCFVLAFGDHDSGSWITSASVWIRNHSRP